MTKIFQKGTNMGIEVPEDVIQKLGAGKRPPIEVTINNYTYKSTVGVMEGKYLIPLSSEHRKSVKVMGGEAIEITLTLDTEPRNVELPKILDEMLKINATAKEFFDALSPSNKKKIVTQIETAKTEDTVHKRLAKIMEDLNQNIKP